jgi:hypothetical protein
LPVDVLGFADVGVFARKFIRLAPNQRPSISPVEAIALLVNDLDLGLNVGGKERYPDKHNHPL